MKNRKAGWSGRGVLEKAIRKFKKSTRRANRIYKR